MKLQPLDDRIVVRANEAEETTVSGLVIPDTAKEKPQEAEIVEVLDGEFKERARPQAFEGVVIRRRRAGISSTFTVRKLSYGIGVERIFPLHSPRIAGIEIVDRGKVRRSRLFYLRGRRGKAARIKSLTRR